MVFTGQGAAWPQFGRKLLLTNPTFSHAIKSLDKHLQTLGTVAPSWSLAEELVKPARTSRVHEAEFSQPLCTAVQIALVDTLEFLGVKPAAVVGHSSGEIAAAYAAGGLTAEEAISVAFHRGAMTKAQTRPGGMAAVGLSWGEAQEYLVPGVIIACDNSPSNVTLSGDADKLADVVATIKGSRPNVPATVLKVEKAYHSHHMEVFGDDYEQAMAASGVVGKAPLVPFFSSVTGKRFGSKGGDHFGPSYWRSNLERPVLFRNAVSSILHCPEVSNEAFLEVGPHTALAGPLRQILAHNGSKAPYIASLVRRQDSVEALLQAVGKLYTLHVDLNFKNLMPYGSTVSDMPHYPWDHKRSHWHESRVSKEWRSREHPYHDLLGIKVPECTDLEPVWRNLLHIENTPWLCDHKINEDVVFPFAAYVAMAAEAARQVSGIEDGVSLRHVAVKSALLVNEDTPTELVTTLRQHKLTDTLHSEWWEFSISSHNGHVWTKHCSGEVRAELFKQTVEPVHTAEKLPRKVDITRWNDTLRRSGLNYGRYFNAIKEVKCSTGEPRQAAGDLNNNKWGDEAQYHLHPVILDSYFQLLVIAYGNGMAHTYRRLVAASVESLTIYRCTDEQLNLLATADLTEDGFTGHGSCASNSNIVLQASGVHASFFEEADTKDDHSMPITAQCEWVPHVDFQNFNDLIKQVQGHESSLPLLNELAKLATTFSQAVVRNIHVQTPYLVKYSEWLGQQSISQIQGLDTIKLLQDMDSLVKRLEGTSAAHAAETIITVCNNIESLLKEEKTGFEILNANGDLERFMEFVREHDDSSYLRRLAHSKPNLRVLEIGAELGGRTTNILKNLTRPDGQILYSQYVFANAASGIVNTAKEHLKGVSNMEFATWDMSHSAADHELEGRQFDLIIATSIIHASPIIQDSLRNIHRLLAPDGKLLVQEPKSGLQWTKFVLGILPGWWSQDQDGRMEEPFTSMKRWQEELVAAGFDGVNYVASDSETSASKVIVASPQSQKAIVKRITLLCDKGLEPNSMVEELEAQGYEIHRCSLGEIPPEGQDVLALLDEEQAFFNNIDSTKFAEFKAFIHSLRSSGILWVTRLSNVGCQDPRYAPVIGLARTLRSEMAIDFAVCEINDLESPSGSRALFKVLHKFQKREEDGILGPDYEYAIYNGEILNNRIFPFSFDQERIVPDSSGEANLTIASQGRLDTLRWTAASARAPKEDEVEVEIYASGLNFRDVLVAMGIIERREPTFGYEAAGIVRRVGANVTKLCVGDRAVLMGMETFSTVVTAPEMLYEQLPDGMSFVEGASMPLVFTTAIYSLIDVGRLSRGQSVLIHSGCGGVGLAAIQIAQMLGAEVFTTVSSEEKTQYLMDTYNIPRNRIFNSRNNSFVENLLRETNGKGVDLALNSLSGELLHATWSCIAKWGTMVEIGKRDLMGAAKLDMTPFLANRNYCCVDLDQMSRERPEMVGRLLRHMMDFFRQGHVKPVQIAQEINASAIQDAFRYMQQGKHIGKIILQLRDDTGRLQIGNVNTTKKGGAKLDAAASYLLVGGLGGLGRAIAVWMVQHGAKNLTFLSRSAGKVQRDHDFVQEIESMGCTAQLVQGDVTIPDDVARAVDGTLAPLKGIIQMSMVLRDQMFGEMSIEDWNAVNLPKVQGTWNLHDVTSSRNLDLDLFILFSSLSGIVGQTGQANYASANTFLDSFARYRANQGLPCTAIDLGAMEGIGYLSENQELLRKMQGTGWHVLQEAELLGGLNEAMTPPPAVAQSKQNAVLTAARCNFLLGISPSVPLSSPDSNSRLQRDMRMAVYHNVSSRSSKNGSANDGLRSYLKSIKNDPNLLKSSESISFLALEIGKKLFSLLLRSDDEEINIKSNTADLGLDSLIAVELRNWWKLNFGFDIAVLEMLSMGTLEALGKFAADKLLVMLDG
ncbi:Highly reducing polyketide synthase [Lachnellula subtilissima]|uniref:Highly reducing polyketide synthase n=1 Tax=Lachnellula subtilissima TaxID=602034 RepID=A0A8H8RV89_9HELO|nr:Highly reducing polyketide synthase [Lachnellula subtilissima]